MPVSVTLKADKTTAAPGDKVVFTPTVSGLEPGSPEKNEDLGAGTVTIDTSNGGHYTAESTKITKTTPAVPAETVSSSSLTFQGTTYQPAADGTFTVTVK